MPGQQGQPMTTSGFKSVQLNLPPERLQDDRGLTRAAAVTRAWNG